MQHILQQFCFGSEPVDYKPFGEGHINRTYLVTCADGKRYILQRISEGLTKDAEHLTENIARITEHLRRKETDPRKVLTLVPVVGGGHYFPDASGNWRVYNFVENSICFQTPENDEDFYQSALAFGHFEEQLADFPAEQLYETIPDFHNTPVRYRQFHDALERDVAGRKASVEPEIAFLLEREEKAGTLQRMRESGELPTRVTHNDTKLNNVLFDKETRKPLCVIDLDTVMPGLSLYDFGDGIRFGAATAAEDEKDLSKAGMDLHRYRIFRDGFMKACPGLTEKERELLPMGAWVITVEQGVRFLRDYLEGDAYYHTTYPEQNLDRCHTQLAMVTDMEKKWEEMKL